MKNIVTSLIVSYNQKNYISQAIESVLAQKTLCKHEIIISDDGSTDGTNSIIKLYCEKYPNLIKNIGKNKNRGISKNYFQSFVKAHGQYLAVLEGDDFWINDEKIQEQYEFLYENKQYSMSFSDIITINQKKSNIKTMKIFPKIRDADFNEFLNNNLHDYINTFSGCMFRTDLLRLMPYVLYQYRLSEKVVSLFMLNYGRIKFMDKLSVAYRQHNNGVWSGASPERKTIAAFLIRFLCFLACKSNNKEKYLQYIAYKIKDFSRKLNAYSLDCNTIFNNFIYSFDDVNYKRNRNSIKRFSKYLKEIQENANL